jgi:hypothetical protein
LKNKTISGSGTQINVTKPFHEIGRVFPGFHECASVLFGDIMEIRSIAEAERDGFLGIRAMPEGETPDGFAIFDGDLKEAVDDRILGVVHGVPSGRSGSLRFGFAVASLANALDPP